MDWQATLFTDAATAPSIDPDFGGRVRRLLDATAWIDEIAGWVREPDSLFASLLAVAPWAGHERRMYDKVVVEPRLTASWSGLAVPVIDEMRSALSARYGKDFDRGGLNLYRDGRDSVAWHRDKIPKSVDDPIVAIVSLGAPRPFLVRPYGGGPSVRFVPGPGHLLVTGGTMQRRWEHTVPKRAAVAGPRISITFRHG